MSHMATKIARRFLASSSSSWERNAALVKNTDLSNKYLETIRQEHDPALHVKTLEDEIRGTMGKALGRQGEKILYAMKLMRLEREKYEELVVNDKHPLNSTEVVDCAKLHNEYRKEAVTARWELTVHRQAVGFIVNNHKFVQDNFPIGEALPIHDGETEIVDKKKPSETKFGDQLDWWQSVGRWK